MQKPRRERLYNVGLQIACLVISLVLYWLLWGSVEGFVKAVDQGDLLFGDFIIHYYPMGEQFSGEQLPVEGYLYTAFFASILAVLAQLPLTEATVIWGGLQITVAVWLYAITAGSVLGLGKRNRALLLLLFLTSLPLLHNFKWGQVSVFVTLSIVLALVCQQRGRSAVAGLILAVATSVKYYPGVLLVYFLIQRDWRFIITFALGVLACYGLLPMLLLGVEGWSNFTTQSSANFPTYHTFLGSAGSQYFVHVIVRWAYNFGAEVTETGYHVLRWSGVVLFAGHIGLAEWFRRRGGKARCGPVGDDCLTRPTFGGAEFVAALFRLFAVVPNDIGAVDLRVDDRGVGAMSNGVVAYRFYRGLEYLCFSGLPAMEAVL